MKESLPNLTFILPQKNYRHTDLSSSLKEYYDLLATLHYLHEKLAEAKTEIKEYERHSETLMTKFYFHSYAFHKLMSGYEIDSIYYNKGTQKHKLFDIYSSLVLLRAQFETFLMYHHIYVNSPDEDERILRWHAWIYSSLLNRLSFPAESFYAKGERAREQDIVARCKGVIQELPAYRKLTTKQQRQLLDKGSDKLFKHWSTIMEDTGYNEKHAFSYFYNFLCIHAHSEGTSILQINDARYLFYENSQVALTYVSVSTTIICAFITTIRKRYKIVEIVYNTLSQQLRETIEYYDFLAKNTFHE